MEREGRLSAGKMSLFIPVTGTLPTQVQHPIKAFRYTTLSRLPGEFHPGLYHGSAHGTAGSFPPLPELASSQQKSPYLEESAPTNSYF